MNYFIACGGTGAHVMRAVVRMHILGHPFGFFEETEFPHMILVDKDAGTGVDENEKTPWQDVKNFIDQHPGRYYKKDYGFDEREEEKRCEVMDPLPKGKDDNWSKDPYNTLEYTFQDSRFLELITSKNQRKIDYSMGMMASPAVGALLFKLKEFDTPRGKELNRDTIYDGLKEKCTSTENRVLVCGSSVGGTGSSVAPTLARSLVKHEAKVMAVMIHRWFEFKIERDGDEKKNEKAKKRNNTMKENAAGGLASYGEGMAEEVATVLIGVPEKGLVKRTYTSDNQQSCKDSYAHVVAAIACMKHFFEEDECKKGLYGVSARKNDRLTRDIIVWKKKGDKITLGDLGDRAWVLVETLEKFSKILKEGAKDCRVPEKFLNFLSFAGQDFSASAIFKEISKYLDKGKTDRANSRLKDVAEQLDGILEIYKSHIKWLEGFDNQLLDKKAIEIKNKDFIAILKGLISEAEDIEKINGEGKLPKPRVAALALFYKTANFIKDKEWSNELGDSNGGYWPDVKESGVAPHWEKAGELASANDKQKVLGHVYEIEEVSPNSWPNPLAAVEEFAFRIEKRDPLAIRKLEILLVGLAGGTLKLKPIKPPSQKDTHTLSPLSLENLIKQECANLAKYRVIRKKDEKTYGFTSPKTLLCPVPDLSDTDWQDLWLDLTGHSYKRKDWKKSGDWGINGDLEVERVAGWLERIRPNLGEKRYSWANTLRIKWGKLNAQARPFGISEWLPLLYEDEKGEGVPLPLKEASAFSSLPEAYKKDKKPQRFGDIKFLGKSTELIDETFTLISDFRIPGEENPIDIIWKEHLDALQIDEKIFAWGKGEKDEIWVIEKYGEPPKYIKNIRVIDKDTIRIQRTCIPLNQNPVPNSNSNVSIKYPDLPLLPDYIELVKTEKDSEDRSVNHNWKGIPEKQDIIVKEGQEVVWPHIHLLGRSKPVRIRIPIHKETAEAHWMVWPNFKSHDIWRSYYIYEDSSREGLEARVVYLDGEKLSAPQKKDPSDMGAARAVKYDDGHHTGGPPVAICAYDEELKDVGIYVIKLNEMNRNGTWKLAIDFGTSHTVAAFKVKGDTDGEKVVKLSPELIPNSQKGPTYHVSENWTKNNDDKSKFEVWRPTYTDHDEEDILRSLLSSDLWYWEGEKRIGADFETYWEPMRHYAIPVTDLRRPDYKTHVVSGFKRKVNEEGVFTDKERFLQKKYLEMAIEIFIAGIVVDKGNLPKEIQFTFTHPKRGDADGLNARYKKSVEDVLSNSRKYLGYTIKDKTTNFYSESHAARGTVGKGQAREVKLVADLGGGTLDISISTSDETNPEENRFNQVEDSAELGGDILLNILANDAEKYLPHGDKKGWDLKNPEVCFKQLRAWMRTEGSSRLFSEQHHDWKPIDDRLGLSGLPELNDPLHARKLIAHYFGLIVDFLARSLVAYVEKYVWDKLYQHEPGIELYIKIQGNGWRLWYEKKSYQEIEERMREWIQTRAAELWKEFRENDKKKDWPSSKHDDLGPKIAPICHAINISDETEKDSETSYKFPLSKVYLEDKDPALCGEKEWYESLPFENVQQSTIVKVKNFEPPVHISVRHGITSIDDPSMRKINDKIKHENKRGGMDTFDAFIAAVIWENVLKSKEFQGS